MPRPQSPAATIETPAKKTSTGVLAGRLYERIQKLAAERDAELADAPQSIHRRFAEKRMKLITAAPPDVSELVSKMLAADEGKPAD